MAKIGTYTTSVTALYKFYHTDLSKFLDTAGSTTQRALSEYPHEFYAVAMHSSDTTSNTVIRFVKNSAGVYNSLALEDPATSAPITLTGYSTANFGMFDRVLSRVYYSDYNNKVQMIQPRTSSGDTRADWCRTAGIPDPNQEIVISRMDETASWFITGDGTYTAELDYAVTHRMYGNAAIRFEQLECGCTTSLSYEFGISSNSGTIKNLTVFPDGTTSNFNDYICFNVFRFDKGSIKKLMIEIGSDSGSGTWTNYFFAPICLPANTDLNDLETSATWSRYDFRQNTILSRWHLNPYDNQMFHIRIRKSWFLWTGTPAWTNITKVRFQLTGATQATASNPAQISVNDLKVMKSPPIATTFQIPWAGFNQYVSGSSTGWVDSNGATAKFCNELATEGCGCIVVCGGNSQSPVYTCTFSSARDFVTFPDGSTANNSDMVRMDITWKGMGKNQLTAAAINWSLFVNPRIRLHEGANWRQFMLLAPANLRGGGVTKQIRFKLAADGSTLTGSWTGSATAIDLTKVDKISIYGPRYNSSALGSPITFDNLRLERPKAQRSVNIFEPIDIYALAAIDGLAETYLPNYAVLVDFATDWTEWWFKSTKYKTHGYGSMTYPDYEHSSLGIAGCTLRAWGSAPFGVTMQLDGSKFIDLDNYYVPVFNPVADWTWPYNWGFWKYEKIPGTINDKFTIWIAAEKPYNVNEITIKLHGNNGGNADLNNYWEYRITGQELVAKMIDQKNLNEEIEKKYNNIQKSLKNVNVNAITLSSALNFYVTNKDEVEKFFSDAIKLLGKDRGGWPAAEFSWKKSEMLLVRKGDQTTSPVWSDVRGHTFEVSSFGADAAVTFDNFRMSREGALNGTYYYRILLEDDKGFLSSASEISEKVIVEKNDVVLNDIYVPSAIDRNRVINKKIYRLGGSSTEWRHVGDLAVTKTDFFDNKREEDMGVMIVEDAYPPPRAKIMKAIGNVMYYGNIVDRLGTTLPYRVYRSEAFCPYRVSDLSCIDIPEKLGRGVTGIDLYYNYICIWTPDSMWTTDRLLEQTPVKRADEGCIAPRSIQVTPYGIIYLSRSGLVIGDISNIDTKYFLPINPIFDSYTEEELYGAIGVYRNKYYYLFFDPKNASVGGRVICCYLPDKLFSEFNSRGTSTSDTTSIFDVKSICQWRGSTDTDDIYAGRSNGEIIKLFDGYTDNETAIISYLRSKDFTQPGIQFDKFSTALYVHAARIGTANSTFQGTFYGNQTAIDTGDTKSATVTGLRSFVTKAQQGDYGQNVGFAVSATHPLKITEMVLKIETEEDVEYFS